MKLNHLNVVLRNFRRLQLNKEGYWNFDSRNGIFTSIKNNDQRKGNTVTPVSNISKKETKTSLDNLQLPPQNTKSSWIAPPNEASNLRLTHFYVPENELTATKEFREKVEEIQAWNQSYWEKHNQEFSKMKEEFICSKLKEINTKGELRQTLTADEMTLFYKKFLNDNHKKHVAYNSEWYKKNATLVWYSGKASVAQMLQNVKKVLKLKLT